MLLCPACISQQAVQNPSQVEESRLRSNVAETAKLGKTNSQHLQALKALTANYKEQQKYDQEAEIWAELISIVELDEQKVNELLILESNYMEALRNSIKAVQKKAQIGSSPTPEQLINAMRASTAVSGQKSKLRKEMFKCAEIRKKPYVYESNLRKQLLSKLNEAHIPYTADISLTIFVDRDGKVQKVRVRTRSTKIIRTDDVENKEALIEKAMELQLKPLPDTFTGYTDGMDGHWFDVQLKHYPYDEPLPISSGH